MLLSALVLARLAAGADTTLLRILTINDFHGALDPRVYGWSSGRPVGGVAALKTIWDSVARVCTCTVLRLDGGDEMQGTLASNLLHGAPVVEAFNLLGVDAAVVGNHELDWGVDTLRARMAAARYPWLAANVFDSATGRRPAWAEPFRILERGGMRIAIVGYMARATKSMLGARQGAGLVWRSGAAAIGDVLDSVRARSPDLTILLAHEGGTCDTLPCRGEIIELAEELDSTRVQLIVAGHTHQLMNTVVRGIPIVQARSSGTAYSVVDRVRSDAGALAWRVRIETPWADQVKPDSAMVRLLERNRPLVDRLAGRRVAVLRDSLPRRGDQTALGNLIADAQRAAAPDIDVAIMNNGGIRRDLYPGPVTYGDLFELHPFGNLVTRVTVTGRLLKDVMENGLRGGKPRIHVSGLVVRYDPARPDGSRVVEMRRPDGTPVDPERSYVLGLSDFLQAGAEGFQMLRLLPDRRTGKTDLEAMIDYLERLPQPVVAPTGSRIVPVTP